MYDLKLLYRVHPSGITLVSVAEPAMYDLKLVNDGRHTGACDVSVAEPAMYDLKHVDFIDPANPRRFSC